MYVNMCVYFIHLFVRLVFEVNVQNLNMSQTLSLNIFNTKTSGCNLDLKENYILHTNYFINIFALQYMLNDILKDEKNIYF